MPPNWPVDADIAHLVADLTRAAAERIVLDRVIEARVREDRPGGTRGRRDRTAIPGFPRARRRAASARPNAPGEYVSAVDPSTVLSVMFQGPPKTSIEPPWKVEFEIVPLSSSLVRIKSMSCSPTY